MSIFQTSFIFQIVSRVINHSFVIKKITVNECDQQNDQNFVIHIFSITMHFVNNMEVTLLLNSDSLNL
jgi:hypothetical protein